MTRALVVVVVLLALAPVMPVLHTVVHGGFAEPCHDDGAGIERDCTPIAHACGCHSSLSAVAPVDDVANADPPILQTSTREPNPATGREAEPPSVPPPIRA